VDDGSAAPVDAAHLAAGMAERCGPVPVEVVRQETSGGPGAARNAGLAAVQTSLVALVDSDVVVTPSWLAPLTPLFADDRLAIAAPRVSSGSPLGSGTERYEWSSSPLDLGASPGRVGRERRITYVPAAALVVRRDALAQVGGFDESLRVGEDVDLIWRLDAAGWACRYEPAARVDHAVRPSWPALVRQRVDYGRSAAALDARHPNAVAPVVWSRWSAAVWALAVSGHPWVALGLAGWTGRALDRKLGPAGVPPLRSLRLVVIGHLGAGTQLARAVVRPWAPLAAVVSVIPGRFGRRSRRVLGVAVAVSVLREHRRRRPTLALQRWAPRWMADELAYTAGVWTGVARQRRVGPLVPRLSDWPTASRLDFSVRGADSQSRSVVGWEQNENAF
jgi:mycofactocin system glycosyltransferase